MSLNECFAKLGFQISSAIQWKSDQSGVCTESRDDNFEFKISGNMYFQDKSLGTNINKI